MFCRNCGAKLEEGSLFCMECGTKLTQEAAPVFKTFVEEPKPMESLVNEPVQEAPAGETPYPGVNEQPWMYPQKKKSNPLKFIIPIVAVLMAGLACFLIFGVRSEKKLVKQALEAQYEGDAKLMWKLYPKAMKEMMKDWGYSEREILEELEDELYYSKLDRGYTYKYRIVDKESYSKSEIREMKEEMRDEGIKGFSGLTAAKEVEVEVDIYDDDGDYYDTDYMYITIVKIGLSWYLIEM